MLKANEDDIRWLIFDSGLTFYRIAKDTGIPKPNVYRLQQRQSQIENLRFNTASTLTAYAQKARQNTTIEEIHND